MRIFYLLSLIAIAFSACNQNAGKNETAENTISKNNKPDTLCFERYNGSENQDTASIAMIIIGDQVSGRYANYPYQKDAREGTINGIKSGENISGIWRYQQEGKMDSLAFDFKLEGEKLLQKQTSFDRKTGRETVQDTAAFSLEFIKRDCQSTYLQKF